MNYNSDDKLPIDDWSRTLASMSSYKKELKENEKREFFFVLWIIASILGPWAYDLFKKEAK